MMLNQFIRPLALATEQKAWKAWVCCDVPFEAQWVARVPAWLAVILQLVIGPWWWSIQEQRPGNWQFLLEHCKL